MLSSRKRRRKTAGRRVAPFIPMPKVLVLTGSEWQPFLELLPSRPRSEILRDRLNELLLTYLGYLDGEARSPSSREVAKVLHDIARRANQFAKDLFLLERRAQDGQDERFNTPDEVASRILTNIMVKPDGRSALQNALRANELLARVADREAKELAESSRKGKPTHGEPTAWMLRRLIELLREHGLRIRVRPKFDDPVCVLSKCFLEAARNRATSLKGSDWAIQEIKRALGVSDRVFMGRLQHAAEAASES